MDALDVILKLADNRLIAKQAKRPFGLFGKWIMTRVFEKENADLNTYMYDLADIQATDQILEVGFGSGKWLAAAAERASPNRVRGVDWSSAMVDRATQKYRPLIHAHQLEILHVAAEQLPYATGMFDTVCTANTIYYWNDPVLTCRELRRVLRVNGKLFLAFYVKEQLDRHSKITHQPELRLYHLEEVHQVLRDAEFRSVAVNRRGETEESSLYCAVATK